MTQPEHTEPTQQRSASAPTAQPERTPPPQAHLCSPAPIDTSFLPQFTAAEIHALPRVRWHCGGVSLDSPAASADLVTETANRLRAAHRDHLARRSVMDIVEALGRVQQLWADPEYPHRRTAEQLLPQLTGFAPLMVRRSLREYLRTFRRDRLLRFLAQDFPDPSVLDGFRPTPTGGRSHARGPAVLAQVFAGNVPGLPAWDLVCGLLVKSASLGKPASGEPLFASLFARSVAEADPELGTCLAVLPWPGGDIEAESAAFRASDAVMATGGAEALAAIRSRVPAGTRFIPHAPAVGTAVVAAEALRTDRWTETARRAARDAAHYDQQACLSPHVVYVEVPERHGCEGEQAAGEGRPGQGHQDERRPGQEFASEGHVSVETFAAGLGTELAAIERRSPRARLTVPEAAAWMRALEDAEFSTWDDPSRSVMSAPGGEWAVSLEERDARFTASPLGRFVRVVPVSGPAAIAESLMGGGGLVGSASLACAPARVEEFAAVLADAGLDRVTALGRAGSPAPGWHHDGVGSLSSLVTWTDLEPSLDTDLDLYEPDDRSGAPPL